VTAIKVGIVGLGTVGSGTVNVLTRNADALARRLGRPIEICHIGARRDNPACDTSTIKVSRDIFDVVKDPAVEILVELIGGTTVAKDLVTQAIENGKHIVTANKALIAEHGNELFELAAKHKVNIAYEAAVAGGIPIIKAVREGLTANAIQWVAGIINGTGNFILTAMSDEGRAFDEVLKEAQALGYAEADPTFDVEGIDAAHKLAILASISFGIPLQFDKVFTEGISAITPEDLACADELGYRVKHLGIARNTSSGIEMRVHPTLIPKQSLLANVDGVMNAVMINGDAVGPTLYYGAGAGAGPTASGVVADLVDTARLIGTASNHHVPALAFDQEKLSNRPVLPIDAVETGNYLRVRVNEAPGVLAHIASLLSNEGISIEAVLQKQVHRKGELVSIIIITQPTLEKKLNSAIKNIQSLPEVEDAVIRIRLEALDTQQ